MSGPGDHQTYDANGVMAAVYDPALKALRISGSGASGAPANASYVTMVAESGLSNETVLGVGVVFPPGTLGARPAASVAGRLYPASDNGMLYRDNGATWVAIGTVGLDMVALAPAASSRNVIQSTADATELTLKAFAGQTAPKFLVTDENDNPRLVIHNQMEMLLGDGANGITSYGIPSDAVADRITEQLATATAGSGPNGEYTEVGMTARVHDDGTQGFGYLGILGKAFGTGAGQGAINMTLDGAGGGAQFRAKTPSTGQTLDFVNLQDVDGNPLFGIGPTGVMRSNAHAAPADGDLNNSDFALWLKDTVAANAVNFKAKDSAGTVVTRPYAIQPIDSHTATTAFGSLAVGTPKQNTLGYDILIMGTVDITAATGGSLKLGTGSSATPTTDPITASITTAALSVVGFSAVVPNGYYISLASAGTITLSSPVVIAVPV